MKTCTRCGGNALTPFDTECAHDFGEAPEAIASATVTKTRALLPSTLALAADVKTALALSDARDRNQHLDAVMRRVEQRGGTREEALEAGVLALFHERQSGAKFHAAVAEAEAIPFVTSADLTVVKKTRSVGFSMLTEDEREIIGECVAVDEESGTVEVRIGAGLITRAEWCASQGLAAPERAKPEAEPELGQTVRILPTHPEARYHGEVMYVTACAWTDHDGHSVTVGNSYMAQTIKAFARDVEIVSEPPGGVYHADMGTEGVTVYETAHRTECCQCGAEGRSFEWSHGRREWRAPDGWHRVSWAPRPGRVEEVVVCSSVCVERMRRANGIRARIVRGRPVIDDRVAYVWKDEALKGSTGRVTRVHRDGTLGISWDHGLFSRHMAAEDVCLIGRDG